MTYSNSLSYPNVLRLLADEIETTEKLRKRNSQLSREIAQNKLKLKWGKDFEKTTGEFSIREIAYIFNLRPAFLFQYLRDKKILIDQNQANADYRKKGFLIGRCYSFKQKNGDTKTIYSTRITPAGMVHIWTLLWNDGIVPVIDNL